MKLRLFPLLLAGIATAGAVHAAAETIRISEYRPWPLGAVYRYEGKDWDGYAADYRITVQANQALDLYSGKNPVVRHEESVTQLYHESGTYQPGEGFVHWADNYDLWLEYLTNDGATYRFFGHDESDYAPSNDESIRVDGGFGFPDSLTVGVAVKRTSPAYIGDPSEGVAHKPIGNVSLVLKVLAKTSVIVPCGTYSDSVQVRFTGPDGAVWDEWWARGVGLVKLQGVSGDGAKRRYSLVELSVPATPVVITGTRLPAATFGVPYSQVLNAVGGVPPYAWSVSDGSALPPGFILGDTGALTGLAEGEGAHAFALDVLDADGNRATQAFTLSTIPPVPTPVKITTPPAGQTLTSGQPVTLSVVATGIPAPTYQWYKNGKPIVGATGAELVFEAARAADTGSYTVKATNSTSSKGVSSAAARLVVLPRAPVVPAEPLARTVSGLVDINLSSDTADTGVTYSAKGLPAGLKLDAKTGILSGVITGKPGSYNITVWATAAGLKSAPATCTLTVAAFPASWAATGTAAWEGLLVAPSATRPDIDLPVGKLSLLTAATLATPQPKTYAVKGRWRVAPDGLSASATVATGTKSGAYHLTIGLVLPDAAISETVPLTATLARLGPPGTTPVFVGQLHNPVRLAPFTGKKTDLAPWRGVYNASFTTQPELNLDTTAPVRALPTGTGSATLTVAVTGILKAKGKLADGTPWTASLFPDASAAYRCFVQPYKTSGNTFAGNLAFASIPEAPVLYAISADAAFLFWHKPEAPADRLFPAGFGPVGVELSATPKP